MSNNVLNWDEFVGCDWWWNQWRIMSNVHMKIGRRLDEKEGQMWIKIVFWTRSATRNADQYPMDQYSSGIQNRMSGEQIREVDPRPTPHRSSCGSGENDSFRRLQLAFNSSSLPTCSSFRISSRNDQKLWIQLGEDNLNNFLGSSTSSQTSIYTPWFSTFWVVLGSSWMLR